MLKSRPKVRAESALGEVALRGFYSRIPVPDTFTCSSCGEERHLVGQEDGLCLCCRWAKRPDPEEGSSG
jgi:hypothetical protein